MQFHLNVHSIKAKMFTCIKKTISCACSRNFSKLFTLCITTHFATTANKKYALYILISFSIFPISLHKKNLYQCSSLIYTTLFIRCLFYSAKFKFKFTVVSRPHSVKNENVNAVNMKHYCICYFKISLMDINAFTLDNY